MSRSILSRFDDVWPPVTKELEAWEVCRLLWPDMYRVQCRWHGGIKAAIQSGELSARLEKGEPPRTEWGPLRQRFHVTKWGFGEPPFERTRKDVPATPARYFLAREDFRLWLVQKSGGTHDDSPAQKALSGPTPDERTGFTLRKPERDRDSAMLVYKTALALYEENGQMPEGSEITAYLLAGKDKTRLVAEIKGRVIHLKDGSTLNGAEIKRSFKRML